MLDGVEEYDSILLYSGADLPPPPDDFAGAAVNRSIILSESPQEEDHSLGEIRPSYEIIKYESAEAATTLVFARAEPGTSTAAASPTAQSKSGDRFDQRSEEDRTRQEFEKRIELALFMYYRGVYTFYQPPDWSTNGASLRRDIWLASRIPNRVQESFEGRLMYLLNENGFVISRDAVLRPGDASDAAWQVLLSERDSLAPTSDGNDDDQTFYEEGGAEVDEEEEGSFKSVVAQSAGAYLFTSLLPATLGMTAAAPLSLPALTICACVGAVAGQVAWDSVQQHQVLQLPPQRKPPKKLATAGVPPPPTYPPALNRWRHAVYRALAHSERAIALQKRTAEYFADYWLQQRRTESAGAALPQQPTPETGAEMDDWELLDGASRAIPSSLPLLNTP